MACLLEFEFYDLWLDMVEFLLGQHDENLHIYQPILARAALRVRLNLQRDYLNTSVFGIPPPFDLV